ncbi:MAG: hypothetical protein FJZ08_00265 [Candidatus Omnitrophica bacterium]|nr:hypothetical protein [Candidatus Omnitrophota bacterium]
MAISRIKKLELIGLKKDKEGVLSFLQKAGLAQLIEPDKDNIIEGAAGLISEKGLPEIQDAISLLSGFQKQTAMLGGMIKPKPLIYQQELKQVVAGFDYQSLLLELSSLRNQLKDLSQQKEKLAQERYLLLPWRRLEIPLDQISQTRYCGIILGVISIRDYSQLQVRLEDLGTSLSCQPVDQDKANIYLAIFYLKEIIEGLEAALKECCFNFVTLSRRQEIVAQRLLEINAQGMLLDDQLQEVKNKIRRLGGESFKLMVIYDHLSNIEKMQQAQRNLNRQQFTFTLSAWVQERDIKILERGLITEVKEVALFISEPGLEEEPPVELENNRLIQPFEFITKIYGFPKYSEIDPTPYLAPFFFLYFGLCVSDVGYGFILALTSWLVLKKFKMGQQGRKFFRLFLFCGISTIMVGAVTGSWFGDLPDLLAQSSPVFLPFQRFKDSLIILDPIKEPTKLLGFALVLGIIQIWFGNIVAAIGNIKNKRYLEVLLDQLPMLTFLFGFTGMILVFLKLLEPKGVAVFRYAALIAAITLILTQGRFERGWGSRLFYGMYNLYNAISGYLSDILSYSRLWALGLVTGVMASTINLVSMQFSQIFLSAVPFINKVAFLRVIFSSVILAGIFVAGHLVAFLMNLLGAFVHPVRLQFVEFFSKFFKSGGSPFRPFKVETKYINIE